MNIDNFSILTGSELKLLKGIELGCSGIITATCNVTANLSRKVYDDFKNKKDQKYNEKLCNVRAAFDKYNLISGMHSFLSDSDNCFKNILPPLSLLDSKEKEKFGYVDWWPVSTEDEKSDNYTATTSTIKEIPFPAKKFVDPESTTK